MPSTESLLQRLLPEIRVEPEQAPAIVDALVDETIRLGASDLHLLPDQQGLAVQWRVDGVLGLPERIPLGVAANVLARFKVLARLLTYENQKPQEGQFRAGSNGNTPLRVSTFPTLFGEKLVIRLLPSGTADLAHLADLMLPPSAEQVLSKVIGDTSGAVMLVGPAGSGKTTTAYAVVREIARRSQGQRSIASLEDPIEVVLPGVAQAQVANHTGFDLATGLRTLVRQDPEVILIGEVRDAETAQIAYQAALTGQLVITTFHATDVATAIIRLLDMGIPSHMVRGATRAIIAQRLLRKKCTCRQAEEAGRSPSTQHCTICRGSGYDGRSVIAEAVDFSESRASQVVQEGVERSQLQDILFPNQYDALRGQADRLIQQRVTDLTEVDRVLGFSNACKTTSMTTKED